MESDNEEKLPSTDVDVIETEIGAAEKKLEGDIEETGEESIDKVDQMEEYIDEAEEFMHAELSEVDQEELLTEDIIMPSESEPLSGGSNQEHEERQNFIENIKRVKAATSQQQEVGSDIIHMSHSSSESREGLSVAREVIEREIQEYEEEGIPPGEEDSLPKVVDKLPEVQVVEEKEEDKKEEKDVDEEEYERAEGPQEEDAAVSDEEDEDADEDKPSESVVDLLYEIDEEFNPELEYVDTREGDEDWQEPVYDPTDFVSEPYLSDKCSLDKNILEFVYSLGYDSCRRYNLCVLDEGTVLYLSGNYIHIYNIEKDQFHYIRSSSGVGLGHCAKHPFEPIFAVGERGDNPLIILFTYPDLKIIRVLKGGTEKFYNYIYFSPNGEWLISQGGEPDNSLAIWNWKFERKVISQKCLGREVWRAETNPFIVGGITTSGVSHIKFWAMNETFTGLKLRGLSGKFGSNEFCDKYTFCALPGYMVLSPNSNKNVYVWEGEEIRMEMKRRNGQSLHEDDIVYIEFKQQFDEIFTVGLEGKYKVWDYTRVEYGKKSELYDLELQPTFQRRIQDDMGIAHPMHFQRAQPNNPNSELYYMQDKRGSIWLVEMAVKEKLAPSQRVFLGHQNPIGDIAPSPADYYLASVGAEGKLHVYNMKKKKIIMVKYFGIGGTSLLWLPLSIDNTGTVVLVGFTDGTIRVVILSVRARELRPKEPDVNYINIIQALKPHSDAVTVITYNPYRLEHPMVLTASLDKRVFFHWLKPRKEYLKLEPFAFVEVPDPINRMIWNKYTEAVLITSLTGLMAEISLPDELPEPTPNTYQISLPKKISRFTSVKSEILRNIVIERNIQRKLRRKEKRERKKQMQLEKARKKAEKKRQAAGPQTQKISKVKEGPKGEGEPVMDFKRKGDQKDSDSEDGGRANHPQRRLRTKFDDFSEEVIETDEDFMKFLDDIEPQPHVETSDISIPETTGGGDKEEKDEDEMTEEKKKSQDSDEEESSGSKEIDLSASDDDEHEDEFGEISEDEDLPDLYEPPEPSPLYFANYINKDCVWVSVGGYDVGYIYEYKLGQNKPYKSTLLQYNSNIEMNCSVQLFDGEFLVLGLGNGEIKFIKCNPDDFTDFSDYWQFAMHDNLNGRIRKVEATYDMRYMYTVGDDSNIFFYKVSLPETKFPDKKNFPQLLPPPLKLRIDGQIAPGTLSLEDAMLTELHEKRKMMGESRKIVLKRKIDELTQRFRILIELNHGLPETQRLPANYFIINEEFDSRFSQTIKDKKAKMTRNLEIEYWKTKIMRDKIYNYLIKPVKTFKFYLFPFDTFCRVTSFLQEKLSLSFLETEKEAEMMMVDILKKGRDKFHQPLKVIKDQKFDKKFKKSQLQVRPLIKGEEEIVELLERHQKALFIRLNKRRQRRKLLDNILTIFLEEKENKKKQFLEDLEARKADEKNMTYILKSDPNFKLSSLKRISKEKKFFQLVSTRRKIYDLVEQFNSELLRLRNLKSKIAALYKSLSFDAVALQSEFKHIPLPQYSRSIYIVEELEFPEHMYLDDPPEFPHDGEIMSQPFRDHLFSQLYEINKKFPIDLNKIEISDIGKIRTNKFDNQCESDKEILTPWEIELIDERRKFLLSEYIKKINTCEEMIAEYDKELGKLVAMKIGYEIKIYYLKIFFFKYYEELQIIRSHELVENQITNKMERFVVLRHIFILRINIRKKRINQCLEDIKTCNKNYEKITNNFNTLIAGISATHKRQMTRIFRKKWKPEKTDGGDESEESSEEEEEDEDDEEEEEEMDIEDLMAANFAPMDENVRPEGLAKDVFDNTFIYRHERQVEEKKIYEKKLEVQGYKDQIDYLKKKLLTIETLVAMFQVKMSIVLEEKHKALKSVRTIVVLDASQMQHYDIENDVFPPVKECVLFPLYTLKNLEARKHQLREDIVSVQLKKQETVKHVKRLDMDIKYLRQRLKKVTELINKEKIEKFGVPVNLGRLEETILLKIIKEFKYDTFPFHLKFHSDIMKLQTELLRVQKSTGEHIKQNTYEQLKLGALMEQKRIYQEVLKKVKSRKDVQYLSIEDINKAIEEKRTMLKMQAALKKCLLEEIYFVKYRRDASDVEKHELLLCDQLAENLADDSLEKMEDEGEEEYDSFDENEKKDLKIISKISKKKMGKTRYDGKEKEMKSVDSPVELTTEEEVEQSEEEEEPVLKEKKKSIKFDALAEVLEEQSLEEK